MGASHSSFRKRKLQQNHNQTSIQTYLKKSPKKNSVLKPTNCTMAEQRAAEDKPKKLYRHVLPRKYSDRDTEQYRGGYPGKKDNPDLKDNLAFYKNLMKSQPNGDYIDRIHTDWHGNHRLLESHHGYIQWIFPIREAGMNYSAQELQQHEAKEIQSDPACKARVLKSYQMMLDFYGIKMPDSESGGLERASNWKERFTHLNRSYHNYLRITRILKSLGELGFEHLKSPFLEFMLVESLDKRTLDNCADSCLNFWVQTVRDDEERCRLRSLADQLSGREESHL